MIDLRNAELIASGAFRDCYVHPDDDGLCVKVAHTAGRARDERETRVWRTWRTGPTDAIGRELKAVQYLQRIGASNSDYFPRFHHVAETSNGRGLVFERLQGDDGSPLVPLTEFIESASPETGLPNWLFQQLDSYARFCMDINLRSAGLKIENIGLVRRGDSKRLVVFDIKVLEDKTFIPLNSIFSLLRRRQIKNQWERLVAKLQAPL